MNSTPSFDAARDVLVCDYAGKSPAHRGKPATHALRGYSICVDCYNAVMMAEANEEPNLRAWEAANRAPAREASSAPAHTCPACEATRAHTIPMTCCTQGFSHQGATCVCADTSFASVPLATIQLFEALRDAVHEYGEAHGNPQAARAAYAAFSDAYDSLRATVAALTAERDALKQQNNAGGTTAKSGPSVPSQQQAPEPKE